MHNSHNGISMLTLKNLYKIIILDKGKKYLKDCRKKLCIQIIFRPKNPQYIRTHLSVGYQMMKQEHVSL